jgi:PKD repeat protein
MQRISHGKIIVAMICASLLLATFIGTHETRAENEATLLIDPGLIQVSPGDNFTLTINATNVATMGEWQVVLKYNQTVMNVTAMWVPTDNVFGDPAVYQQQTVQPDYGVDFEDGMGYAGFGNSRYVGEVSVSNGILCMVNCTALDEGASTIQLATKSNPVTKSAFSSGFASFLATWSDQYQEYRDIPQPLSVKSAAMTSGNAVSKPIATFVATPTLPESTGHLILNGHAPIGDTGYSQGYETYPVTFNASSSIGTLTLDNGTKVLSNAGISEYHWDFGDGTNVTTNNPIIVHTYGETGDYDVTLWVEDKETPPTASDATELIMVIGLVLDYFNWTPFLYTVFALIAALIVFITYREIRGYLRTKRELRARRLTSKRPSPPMQ